jgi:hypothetical protein
MAVGIIPTREQACSSILKKSGRLNAQASAKRVKEGYLPGSNTYFVLNIQSSVETFE